MRRIMKYALVIFSLVLGTVNIFADGIVVPQQEGYPNDFLKNRITDVSVEIHGLISETVVYQEFRNEWSEVVDGVYTFPLPPGARATRLQYSQGDSLVDAILRVQQQSTNPGTGTGGVVSRINSYMGDNAISLALSDIPPNGIKGVRLSYIESIKQFSGTYQYKYPLNTGEFVKHPLDYIRIYVKVNSSKTIKSYDLISHPGYMVRSDSSFSMDLEYLKPKSSGATDVLFEYTVENEPFSVDLYCWKPDEDHGYFTMVGKPPVEVADSSLSQNLIFLLGNSTTMLGNKLNQSKSAISLALDGLSVEDSFNIMTFNQDVSSWQAELVPATAAFKLFARQFLAGVETKSGNRLDMGIYSALNSLRNSGSLSSLLVFCDGRSPLDPFEIEGLNSNHTGINFIAIGNDIDRVRLEAVAAQNYGFVSYIGDNDVLYQEMLGVFNKIKSPIIKETVISFDDPEVHSLYPQKTPPVFAGTDLVISGRYVKPGLADIEIQGMGQHGEQQLLYQKEFEQNNEISRKLWAKLAIDDVETQILIFGEDDSLKARLIDLSLAHNIRCRYTAFTEQDTAFNGEAPDIGGGEYVSVSEGMDQKSAQILSCYPNPFSDYMVLRFEIESKNRVENGVIRIFDIYGRTIKIIRLSDYEVGMHDLVIGADEIGDIPGALFFVQLVLDNTIISTIKLMKIN